MANYIIPDDFLTRGDFKQEDLAAHPLALTDFRVWDAYHTLLPAVAATDDLALITGTPGTDAPTLQAGDMGGTAVLRKAAICFPMPIEYTAAQSAVVRVHAGILTTVADNDCLVDCRVYSDDGDGTVSADLCATAQQDCNSLTLADFDFSITTTNLSVGDLLFIELELDAEDAGNLGVMIPVITAATVLLDCRG